MLYFTALATLNQYLEDIIMRSFWAAYLTANHSEYRVYANKTQDLINTSKLAFVCIMYLNGACNHLQNCVKAKIIIDTVILVSCPR